jgi:hypothetical protein
VQQKFKLQKAKTIRVASELAEEMGLGTPLAVASIIDSLPVNSIA